MELGGAVVDRLTAAKAVLADFLDRREGDRVGLLVFGQRAYAMTPLTRDLQTVREQLRDAVAGLAGRETAIGDAIALAVRRLRTQQEGQRVLILLTDGVNSAGVLPTISRPCSVRRFFRPGSLMAWMAASASFFLTSAGRPLGAAMPCQE